MNTIRCYVGDSVKRAVQHFGAERCWLQDGEVRSYWAEIGVSVGDTVAFFDDDMDVLYKIIKIEEREIALQKETEVKRFKPRLNLLIAWGALAEPDNSELLTSLIKAGISHLVPLLTQNSDHPQITKEKSKPLIIKALEDSIYSDLPPLDLPISPEECLSTYGKKYKFTDLSESLATGEYCAVMLPPQGGWSAAEKSMFKDYSCKVVDKPTAINEVVLRIQELLK